MAELDLTKAIDAGAREMLLYDYPEALGDIDKPGDPCNLAGYNNSFHSGLTAALPHLLEALAERAEADKAAAAERFRTAPTATERVDASQWGDVCELAAVYLRARAEEDDRG